MVISAIVRQLVRKVWSVAVLMLIIVAVYVSLGRIMLPRLSQYHDHIENYLSSVFTAPVEISSITGSWQGFQPRIELNHLSVALNQQDQRPFQLTSLAVQLDVFHSLLQRKPIFSSVILEGANLALSRDVDGKWQTGFNFQSNGEGRAERIIELLMAQRHLELRNSSLTFSDNASTSTSLLISNWSFDTVEQHRSSSGALNFGKDKPSKMRFAVNMLGKWGQQGFKLDAYLKLEPLELESWLALVSDWFPVNLNVRTALVGGEVWLSWSGDHAVDVRGSLDAPVVELLSSGTVVDPITGIRSDFVWQRDNPESDNNWTLWLNEFTFGWKNEVFEPAQQRWSYSLLNQQPTFDLIADAIDLELTSNTLLAVEQLPQKLRDTLVTLRPRGRLTNAHLSYSHPDKDNQSSTAQFSLESNLSNIAVSPWKGAPGAAGINGYLQVTPKGGEVAFESDELALYFPMLYASGWRFHHGMGRVYWSNEGSEVWVDSNQLELTGEVGEVTGSFSLALPKDGAEARIDLLIGLKNATVDPGLSLVPDRHLDEQLVSWLNEAVIEGNVSEARMVYSGPAKKNDAANALSFNLDIQASDIELAYQPGWPKLTQAAARVEVSKTTALITIPEARLYDMEVTDLRAYWNQMVSATTVEIDTKVTGSATDGFRILRETPVRDSMFDLIDEMEVAGELSANLSLQVALANDQENLVDLNVIANNAQLHILPLDLKVNAIAGAVQYSTQGGLVASGLNADLFNQPISASISTVNSSPVGEESADDGPKEIANKRTHIDIAGRLDMDALRQWQPHPLFQQMEGITDYQVALELGSANNKLVVTSNLEGVAINVPTPYRKTAEVLKPMRFEMLFEEQRHLLNYDNLVDYALDYEEGDYTRGEIRLGGDPAVFEKIPGIAVRGTIESIDIDQWWQFFELLAVEEPRDKPRSPVRKIQTEADLEKYWLNEESTALNEPDTAQQAMLNKIRFIELQSSEVSYAGHEFSNLIIQAEQIESGWWLQLESELVKGKLNILAEANKPMSVVLDYLRLPESDDKGSDLLANVVPSQLPAIDFVTQEFSVGEHSYGAWSFDFRPVPTGAVFERFKMNVAGAEISASLNWLYNNGKHRSSMEGKAVTPELGETLGLLGYPGTIVGGQAGVDGSLSWLGSPAAFSMLDIQGDISVDIGAGRIEDLESMPRILGLFNLGSIARRVRLDFSDVLKKGFSFDRVKGDLKFSQGIISTSEPLVIDGPSAKFKIEGTTDLINEQLDQDVVVVLPLSDIPIAAAIVSVPQVGIPLWLLNTVFGNMFERFTSARYLVKGPWAEPNIELVKIFENKNSKETAAPESEPGAAEEKSAGAGVPG